MGVVCSFKCFGDFLEVTHEVFMGKFPVIDEIGGLLLTVKLFLIIIINIS